MLARNSRLNILNALFGAIALSMIQPYIGILAIKMGANDLQLGYLSSWPNLVSVVAVLGAAAAVARSDNKQRLIAAIFLVGRAAALGVAAVPWLGEQYRVWALIGFWVLAVFPNAAGSTALQSFLVDAFPTSERARALASRQSWTSGAAVVATFATGWLLDNLFSYPLGYQIMFASSFLVALVEIYLFLGMREQAAPAALPPARPAARRLGLQAYIGLFGYRPFARFMLCSLLFHFTWQMAWPIFTRYQVSYLHTNNTWQALVTVANSIVAVFTYPIWARMADRYSNRRTIPVALAWLALAPFLTSLAPNMAWVVVVNLFTGIGVAGATLLILNNLLEVSPSEGRPLYLAAHSALVSVSGAVAPMAGALIMSVMEVRVGLQISTLFRLIAASAFFFLIPRGQKGNVESVEKGSTQNHLARNEG